MNVDRVNTAKSLFESGYNCAQAVFLAFADLYNVPQNIAKNITMSLGRGMGGLKQTCGAVTALFLLAGLENADENLSNRENVSSTYALIKKLSEKLVEQNGDIMCGKLLELNKVKRRTCSNIVEETARIWNDYLENKKN